MSARLFAIWVALLPAAGWAAEQALGVLDIALGQSYARLEHDLDMRDINTALARIQGGKPDLGRRGYGCMQRDDEFADVSCVSHEEKLNGMETREIRLQFIGGRLLQLSFSAEVQHYGEVLDYLGRRYGAPQQAQSTTDGASTSTWRGAAGSINAYRGKDLVFVNFELDDYAAAVKRKREGVSAACS